MMQRLVWCMARSHTSYATIISVLIPRLPRRCCAKRLSLRAGCGDARRWNYTLSPRPRGPSGLSVPFLVHETRRKRGRPELPLAPTVRLCRDTHRRPSYTRLLKAAMWGRRGKQCRVCSVVYSTEYRAATTMPSRLAEVEEIYATDCHRTQQRQQMRQPVCVEGGSWLAE